MEKRTSIVLHKQYATYQACFDLYSDCITNEEVFKKTFLFIIDWLKGRIGEEQLEHISELKKYPAISEYKNLDVEEMYGFKVLSQMDIRLFHLKEENSWALRIIEPDNHAEFESGNMDDASEIRGRSFITEIALKKNEMNTTLAVQIICKEPIANVRDAIAFRPAFINAMYRDKEMELSECGVNRQFGFLKEYDENGKIKALPIVVDDDNAFQFVKELLLNEHRQLPLIICPEKVYDVEYSYVKSIHGVSVESKGRIDTLAYSLMGYAHVVVVKDSVANTLFAYKKSCCEEYGDVLQEQCVIYHKGFDVETGLPDNPIYCSLVDGDDIPDDEEFQGKNPLEIMLTQAKKHSVRKPFVFEPAKFYRELKKQYYKYEGKNDTEAAISNLEHDISEKDALIADLSFKLSKTEQDLKKRCSELKSKFDLSQENLKEYQEGYEKYKKLHENNEQNVKKITDDYEDKIRQKDIMINVLTGKEVPEPSDERKQKFYNDSPALLFDCEEKYKEGVAKDLICQRLTQKLKSIYASFKFPCRRFELVECVLQYNNYLTETRYSLDGVLYYPPSIEFYQGEFKDVLYDAIYEVAEDDTCLNMLLEYNNFDFKQSLLKEEIYNTINGYRHHQSVKSIIERTGFVLISSNEHYKYSYYGDDRYKITVAGSPSDTNSGKNLAESIIEMCL